MKAQKIIKYSVPGTMVVKCWFYAIATKFQSLSKEENGIETPPKTKVVLKQKREVYNQIP
jgi:hypothetical protein